MKNFKSKIILQKIFYPKNILMFTFKKWKQNLKNLRPGESNPARTDENRIS